MQEVKLSPATTSHIHSIQQLATLIWNQHYPSIISQGQINYMLNKMYSEDSLLEQMQIKKHRFFLIGCGSNVTGFISAARDQNSDWYIHKFYVDQQHAAKGIGSAAFRALITLLEPKTVRLAVNRKNFKAINFYFRNGFSIESLADVDIGGGYEMNDFIMKWTNCRD